MPAWPAVPRAVVVRRAPGRRRTPDRTRACRRPGGPPAATPRRGTAGRTPHWSLEFPDRLEEHRPRDAHSGLTIRGRRQLHGARLVALHDHRLLLVVNVD